MSQNIVVYDIETKETFDDVGGRDQMHKLTISVLGAWDYRDSEFRIYEEKELPRFAERLSQKPLLVGFNSRHFDTPILQQYMPFDLGKLPQLDIMAELVKALGHRVSLDSVARATLNAGKSGSGLDAIRFWREGRIEELKRYCLDDVRITRDLYEYGASHSELFYTPKFGSGKARAVVSWKIAHPEEAQTTAVQQSLF
jgi:DEAD/DEAH box helicase domain-containing protein